MTGNQLKVFVVDDHELFRSGIVALLRRQGIEVVGEAGLAEEAISQATKLRPDVVLMDLNMPGMSGIEATQRLNTAAPHVRVVVLTVAADECHIMDALLAGACGYLLKDAPIEQIIYGIEAAARGESMMSPRITSELVRRVRRPAEGVSEPHGAELTNRELEVLQLLTTGMDNPGIARALYVSHCTVKSHVANLLDKLRVENRVQAAVLAVRTGLV
jgi:DNA-binding NarL/FixJ family response regulator